MFAVIKTGGKQYKVSKGQVLRLEKLASFPGKKVQFNEVLLVGGDKMVVGTPFVKDAGVQAEVVDQIRGPKTISFVKRRRKSSSQRKKGHRQSLTVVKITNILTEGAQKSGIAEAVGAGGSVEDFGNFSPSKSPAKAEAPKKSPAKAEAPKKSPAKAEAPKKSPAKAEVAKSKSSKKS